MDLWKISQQFLGFIDGSFKNMRQEGRKDGWAVEWNDKWLQYLDNGFGINKK